MKITQNTDGSLTVEIPYADLLGSVTETLSRTPVSDPTLVLRMVNDLGAQFSAAIRAANVVFDQAVTDTVGAAVKGLRDDRAAAALTVADVVAAPIKAGP